jgi:MFS transporter, YQGE family, putative transporter
MTAQGMREGVFGFAIGLLLYIATKNELKIGNYSLITSALGLLSYWIAGWLFKRKYRLWGSFIGISVIIIVIIPLYWQVSYTTLLFFGIGFGLFSPLYIIPITSVVFDVIGRNEESVEHRVEYVVLREMSLSTGRLFGTLICIAVISSNQSQPIFTTILLVIGSSPLAAWLLLRRWLRVPIDTQDRQW